MQVLIGIISVIVTGYVLWQYQELKKFNVTHYEFFSEKASRELKLAVISDLHSFSYGTGNERLLRAIKEAAPDLILIAEELAKLGVPVYFTNGNHETRALLPDSESLGAYQEYRRGLEAAGIHLLNNESVRTMAGTMPVRISGLELPLSCYEKWKKPHLEEHYLTDSLGQASDDCLQILLAHHPAFARQYAAWGADITVCGHNHGGLICIPGIGSIISPQFMLFPEFDAGEFDMDGKRVYISRGLGTHTIHIRIFNRAELVTVTVKPDNKI